jgi:hypothetical protein
MSSELALQPDADIPHYAAAKFMTGTNVRIDGGAAASV